MKISNNAFRFCRWGVTILIWIAFLLKQKWLMLAVFVILMFSAILGVRRAPMIVLYTKTVESIKKLRSKKVDLDAYAMRVAHIIATIFAGICTILVFLNVKFAYAFVFVFAIIKTISALGVCPVYKATTCARSGCCPLSKKIFKKKENKCDTEVEE